MKILKYLIWVCASMVMAAAQGAEKSKDELIANAMSGGPTSIARDATITAPTADGKMETLRKGTNGWTCMPDNPGTPGNDPMCMDPASLAWLHSIMEHKDPPDAVGFMYMLAGGSDADNTDPYAAKPPEGRKWVETGPHVMIVGPAVKKMTGYPKELQPDTSKPYVMYFGTPYEHLMLPVK